MFPARLATDIGFPMSLGWVWKKWPRQNPICLKNAICTQNIQINSNSLGHSLLPIKIFGRRPPLTLGIYWQSVYPSKALSWSLRKDIDNYYMPITIERILLPIFNLPPAWSSFRVRMAHFGPGFSFLHHPCNTYWDGRYRLCWARGFRSRGSILLS